MGDAEHLALIPQGAQALADGASRVAADAGVDLVEDQGRASACTVAADQLEREVDARELAARRHPLQRTQLLGASTVDDTLPLENRKQPSYLNQMVALETLLAPAVLLDACHAVEREAGRERRERGGSRTLDLDLVIYEGVTMASERLTLPHPGLGTRPFWQRELAELERMGL